MDDRLLLYNAALHTVVVQARECPDLVAATGGPDHDGHRPSSITCPELSPPWSVFCCAEQGKRLSCCKLYTTGAVAVPSDRGSPGPLPAGGDSDAFVEHMKSIDHEALLLLVGAVVSCVLFVTTVVVAFCVICRRRGHTRHKRSRSHGGNVINLEDLSDEELHTRLERPPTYSPRNTVMTMAATDVYYHHHHHHHHHQPQYQQQQQQQQQLLLQQMQQQQQRGSYLGGQNGLHAIATDPHHHHQHHQHQAASRNPGQTLGQLAAGGGPTTATGNGDVHPPIGGGGTGGEFAPQGLIAHGVPPPSLAAAMAQPTAALPAVCNASTLGPGMAASLMFSTPGMATEAGGSEGGGVGQMAPIVTAFNGIPYVEPPPPYQEYPDPNSRILVCRHGGTLEAASHAGDLTTVRFQY